jgi:S-adenosylmethionine hydrolase
MKIITLLSDWNAKDHYLASVKGKIYSLCPDCRIVDISHNIKTYSVKEAAFVLRDAYPHFPEGTIHIVSVLSEESGDRVHHLVKAGGQYFIGADNGLFSLVFGDEMEVYEIDLPMDSFYHSFSTLNRFVPLAIKILQQNSIDKLAIKTDKWVKKYWLSPLSDRDSITGHIQYIDVYENLIVNISKELFDKVGNARKFKIFVRNYTLDALASSYPDAPEGELVAFFNSSEWLEIAINQGNAGGLLGLKINDIIRVEFYL